MTINIIIIITIKNILFSTHTHACEFMTSKTSWHTQKLMVSQKIMDCHEICDTLLPNGMPCHRHMEDQIIINHKRQ
jgi:hypothetical protein